MSASKALAPARGPDEPFEAYAIRRKAGNTAVKKWRRGTLSFASVTTREVENAERGEVLLCEQHHTFRSPDKGGPISHGVKIIARRPMEKPDAEADNGSESAAGDSTPQQQGTGSSRADADGAVGLTAPRSADV